MFFLWAKLKLVNFSVHVKCKTNDWMRGCEGSLRPCSRYVTTGLWNVKNLNKNLQSQMTLNISLDRNSFSRGSGVRHRWRLKGNSTNCFPRTTADVNESTLKHALTPEEAACNLINCLQRSVSQWVKNLPPTSPASRISQTCFVLLFFSRKQKCSPRSVNTLIYRISGFTL